MGGQGNAMVSVTVTRNRYRFWKRNLPNVHVLHTHDHVVVGIEEGTVKGDNVFAMAVVHDLEFSHNTLAHFSLGFHVDNLWPE